MNVPRWHWIPDIHNFHRFHSVQWGALGIACGVTLAAYAKLPEWSPKLQAFIPDWSLHIVTVLFVVSPVMSIISRAIGQPNLPPAPPAPPSSNDFHQGGAP